MNFFESELRKLFGDGQLIGAPAFAGRACLGTLGQDLRVRAQFVTVGHADHYEALRVTVLNRTGGEVDTLTLRFKEELGRKPVPGNPYLKDGVIPHIWVCNGKAEWYAYQPTQADRSAIRKTVGQYLDVFRERQAETVRDGPKLVYICAPLRGKVEQNVEFARQKAQEVFRSGDIPVCPHLMFPPIADTNHPSEDQRARDMGLRLVESCQQVNVYGPVWTDGMWEEINHANRLGIPIMTDQQTIGRPPKRNQQRIQKKNQR